MPPLRKAKLIVPLVALSAVIAGCTKPASDPPQVPFGQAPSAALVIETSVPKTTLAAIRALVAGSACPREHLEVLDPNVNAGRVLDSSIAPGPPTMTGPVPPRKPPRDATQYQQAAYAHQHRLYEAKLAYDRHALQLALNRRTDTWAASVTASVSANAPTVGRNIHFREGLSDATAFFASLNQTAAKLGLRKVIVIFATEATTHGVLPIRPRSLHGASVIVANFKTGPIRRAILRDNLRQAGAGRAIILAPAAIGQLPTFVHQALCGPTPDHSH